MIGYISHVPMVPRTRGPIMQRLLGLRDAHPDQLIVIAANASREDRAALIRSGVAVFDDPAVATGSVAKLVRAGQAFGLPARELAPARPAARDRGELARALARAGAPLAEETPTASPDEALDALAAHGEIVLKLSAPSLTSTTRAE